MGCLISEIDIKALAMETRGWFLQLCWSAKVYTVHTYDKWLSLISSAGKRFSLRTNAVHYERLGKRGVVLTANKAPTSNWTRMIDRLTSRDKSRVLQIIQSQSVFPSQALPSGYLGIVILDKVLTQFLVLRFLLRSRCDCCCGVVVVAEVVTEKSSTQ
jgi:hypothetical protein